MQGPNRSAARNAPPPRRVSRSLHGRARRVREFFHNAMRHWAIVLLFLVFAVAIVIGSVRVGEAELSMTTTSDIAFVALSDDAVTSDLTVRQLRLIDVSSLSLDGGSRRIDATRAPIDVSIEAPSSGVITLPSFDLPRGTQVRIRRGSQGRYTMTLSGTATTMRAVIPSGGTITGVDSLQAREVWPIAGPAPAALEIAASASGVELDFELQEPWNVLSAAAIRELRFWSVESRSAVPGVRTTGIREGQITFLEQHDRAITLRAGDDIDILLQSGIVHDLSLSVSGIAINVSGRVDDLRQRIGFSKRSQLPTWFDKLSEMPLVRAVVGLLTLLVGLEFTRYLRWRKP